MIDLAIGYIERTNSEECKDIESILVVRIEMCSDLVSCDLSIAAYAHQIQHNITNKCQNLLKYFFHIIISQWYYCVFNIYSMYSIHNLALPVLRINQKFTSTTIYNNSTTILQSTFFAATALNTDKRLSPGSLKITNANVSSSISKDSATVLTCVGAENKQLYIILALLCIF